MTIQKDGEYFPQVVTVPYRGENSEQVEAHLAFESQLRYTQEMLRQTLEEHAHYTDDCGDYLGAALELSYKLQDARTMGVEELLEVMENLIKEDEEGRSEYENFASDGVSQGFDEWARKQGWKSQYDKEFGNT